MQSNRQEPSNSHSARTLTAAGHFLEVLTLLVAVWAVGDDTLLVSHVTSDEWLAPAVQFHAQSGHDIPTGVWDMILQDTSYLLPSSVPRGNKGMLYLATMSVGGIVYSRRTRWVQ